jgi:hypothetical protein
MDRIEMNPHPKTVLPFLFARKARMLKNKPAKNDAKR